MSVILSLLVFCVLICLLHVILQAIPGLCPSTIDGEPSSHFCAKFHQFWHKISLYDRDVNLEDLDRHINEQNDEQNDEDEPYPLIDQASHFYDRPI